MGILKVPFKLHVPTKAQFATAVANHNQNRKSSLIAANKPNM